MTSQIGTSPLVSTSEAASALNCSVTSVMRIVTSGDLEPAAKAPGLRGAYLFARADVEALAAKRSEAGK